MSTATATNGAATGSAFNAIAAAFGTDGSFASSADKVRDAGETWFEQSKAAAALSLDAFDAAIRAYVELTRSAAAAAKVADWAIGLAERNADIVSELTRTCSGAARDLLGK